MTARLTVPVGARDHISGAPNAPLVLLEYGDFECPFCAEAHQVVQEIQQLLGPNLCFVFRHFPLATVHPHAQHAAEAAEAAGAQGAFWPMHDILFENNRALDDLDLLIYADSLSLDMEQFSSELSNHIHASRVREDFMGGVRSGVNGTPTFFINGERYDGSFDPVSMLAALETAGVESRR
ncbi:DsbA family protein [Microbulbifer magnicolonia]|uniref:DsbA family protein n=1 Tax=Microbulbifer magnicolonia TaxID=3109744 RepID=UPI002B40E5D0|nr:DsbA family protein [Microbulbifer sp. GG15]